MDKIMKKGYSYECKREKKNYKNKPAKIFNRDHVEANVNVITRCYNEGFRL